MTERPRSLVPDVDRTPVNAAAIAELVDALDEHLSRGGTVASARNVVVERDLLEPDVLGSAFAHARRTKRCEKVKQVLAALLADVLPQPPDQPGSR